MYAAIIMRFDPSTARDSPKNVNGAYVSLMGSYATLNTSLVRTNEKNTPVAPRVIARE